MHPEKYNMNWQTFTDHLKELLHEMMLSNELTDVTLVCDDKKQLKAHKIILSACSPVFKSIIECLPQNNSVIYLSEIYHQEMESILEFIYLGESTFEQKQIDDFLKVARKLEIKGIGKNVDIELKENVLNQNKIYEEIIEEKDSINIIVLPAEKSASKSIEPKNTNDSNDSGVKYDCNQCNFETTKQSNMVNHILENKHEIIKYSCCHCSYQAATQRKLNIHVQSKHDNIHYYCSHCNYRAPTNAVLKKHVQVCKIKSFLVE